MFKSPALARNGTPTFFSPVQQTAKTLHRIVETLLLLYVDTNGKQQTLKQRERKNIERKKKYLTAIYLQSRFNTLLPGLNSAVGKNIKKTNTYEQ